MLVVSIIAVFFVYNKNSLRMGGSKHVQQGTKGKGANTTLLQIDNHPKGELIERIDHGTVNVMC